MIKKAAEFDTVGFIEITLDKKWKGSRCEEIKFSHIFAQNFSGLYKPARICTSSIHML